MPSYTQTGRLLAITTPLGPDALLLVGLQGREAMSRLFRFQLTLLAENRTRVAFDALLGRDVTVELALPNEEKRAFHGIINRLTQGRRDADFTYFQAEMVPQFWFWTKKVQSRIFQHLAVPDILKQVLAGLNVSFELQGNYQPRDYCVQYRESDFAFASRLMEEEGIAYFFKHTAAGPPLIVTDVGYKYPDLPEPNPVIYEEVEGGGGDEARITAWEKTQEVRAGKYTLWDHCFELPGKNLEAQQTILKSVTVGQVAHTLQTANDRLEIYDYPGGYAQRFDGVDKGGGDQAAELMKVFQDNQRTVKIRMEQEALPSLEIQGASACGHFVPGHQFTLTRHFDADGPYLLTQIDHEARLSGNYRTGEGAHLNYRNRFTAIPTALPYRPARVTPRPTVAGTQTATVVGPPGEEIFCDKYGRIKVQFHWDRQGQRDANSSCWVRVAQAWAGKGWGAFFWPRVGHEVVVAFEEGDPDQPIIVGSVYNAANMPPFALPQRRMLAGFKSASVRGNPNENFNGVVFVDEKGHEHLAIHSERHMSFNTEFDKEFHAGRHKGERVSCASVLTVGKLPGGS